MAKLSQKESLIKAQLACQLALIDRSSPKQDFTDRVTKLLLAHGLTDTETAIAINLVCSRITSNSYTTGGEGDHHSMDYGPEIIHAIHHYDKALALAGDLGQLKGLAAKYNP